MFTFFVSPSFIRLGFGPRHGTLVWESPRGGHGLQSSYRSRQRGLLLPICQPGCQFLRQFSGEIPKRFLMRSFQRLFQSTCLRFNFILQFLVSFSSLSTHFGIGVFLFIRKFFIFKKVKKKVNLNLKNLASLWKDSNHPEASRK